MKIFNYWYLSLVLLLSLGSHSCAQNKATIDIKEDEKLIEFTTDRFTLPNLHVTPDGKNIIFDVLGDIYKVPIEGGKAEVLLQDNNWKRGAKLSPDSKTLAYVSDESGLFQVWTIDLETKEKRLYPIIESVHYPLYSYWRDKRRLLIPSKEGLQSFDIVTGEGEIIRPALEEERSILHAVNKKMSANKPGNYGYLQKSGDLWAYDLGKDVNLFIGSIPDKAFVESIKGSDNGEKVVFYKKKKEDNSKQDLMSWNLSTNNLEILTTTQTLGFSTKLDYSFDFIDDTTIVLDKEGEVVRMNVTTGEFESIPIEVEVKKIIKKPLKREPQYIKDSIITANVLRNPVTKPDLDTIYFGAYGKLHSYSKTTEVITEMYPDEERFEVSPSLSPDGKYLAYTTWNDLEMGHVYAREIKTGKEYQITKSPGRYINPAWSPDGTEIVFVADETEAKMGLKRQTSSKNTTQYHLDVHRIKFWKNDEVNELTNGEILKRIYPFSIIPRRYYPVPVYNINGKSIYVTTNIRLKNIPTIIEIDLKSKEVIQEVPIPFHTDEVIIAPNSEHIAFVFDEQVWVDTFPYSIKLDFFEDSEFVDKRYHYKGGSVENIILHNAKAIFEIAPSYLFWQDQYTLMWGSAEEVYTYDVRTGVTEKIADIKVQKLREVPKTHYALTNARIITMNKQDEIIEKGIILVKDNRIQEVGSLSDIKIPENYKIFDLEGKIIMPGFIDVHAHYHLTPYEFTNQQEYQYIGNLAYGVTTIYDPSVNVLDYREQAQMVETGQLLGPRVFASGNIILDHPTIYDYKTINFLNDTERLLKSNVKLHVMGPIKQYNRINRIHRKWLYESAKKNELTLTNHETNFLSALTQIIDGYTAMEHEKYTFPLQKDIINLIGHSKIHYTPTFMVSPGIYNLYSEITTKEKPKLQYLNGKVLYHNYFGFNREYNYEDKDIEKWVNFGVIEQNRAITTIKKIVKSGGEISVGGHGNPLPGIGTHWELWFTAKGMSNYQALQAATINGAEKLDLQEELGTIAKGKLADMVVLNSDPLFNIFNSIDLLYTIQNGYIYDAENMNLKHPVKKVLKPWGWNSPTVLENMESIYIKGN